MKINTSIKKNATIVSNGDWGLGIGDGDWGPIPHPQSPIPKQKKLI